jgi:hypothetical protein
MFLQQQLKYNNEERCFLRDQYVQNPDPLREICTICGSDLLVGEQWIGTDLEGSSIDITEVRVLSRGLSGQTEDLYQDSNQTFPYTSLEHCRQQYPPYKIHTIYALNGVGM